MPRWPAFARRARLPGPIFWDVALALAIAAVSLLTLEAQREGVADKSEDTEVTIQPTPITPGDPVVITVRKGGEPFRVASVEPLLTIQNVTTGRWKTYVAKATARPGVYRIPTVDPGEGVYSYTVMYGPFEQNVRVRGPNEPVLPPVPSESAEPGSLSLWAIALTLLATLPIAVRRRLPWLVFAATMTAALVLDIRYNSFQFAGAVVALYTVAAYVGRPGSIGGGVGTALALPVTQLDGDSVGIEEMVSIYVIFAVAWILGDRIGARRAYLRGLEERAAQHEREREEHARRAAAEEQARIARELHDIIAHNVSVMTVQAAAAGDAFETQPGKVREALASIESTGREALTELRRLLGTVRPGDVPNTFVPQPGLARIDDLLDHVRATGLEVELTVEGTPRELPPGIELSAYRIVQEALTNTLKHAAASRATVILRYGETLDIEVADDGRGATTDGAERGHGLIGMRERAALVGGELTVGASANGGFAIRARVPLEDLEP